MLFKTISPSQSAKCEAHGGKCIQCAAAVSNGNKCHHNNKLDILNCHWGTSTRRPENMQK